MKRILFYLLILLPAILSAQSKNTYLPAEEMSTPQTFLPGPPALQDARFFTDWVAYQQGKDIRMTERGYRAIDDASTSVEYFMQRFGEAMGVAMTPENCPNIAKYLNKTFSTAKQANSKAKDFYARVRPYNQFHEDTPIKRSQSPTDNTSYPSGHTCRAWSSALALVAIDPDHQNEILKVGYDYGQSRVILGYHYQSDIDAARLVASTGIARLMGEKEFQEDMAAAKADLEKLRQTTAPRIRTVIVTNDDNCSWYISTIAIAKTLRNTCLFSVDIAGAVDFSNYDLVIYDGSNGGWCADMQASFDAFTANGGGVVCLHAADTTAASDEFVMSVSNAKHPVTEGMPTQWKHARDRYAEPAGKLKNADILLSIGKSPIVYTFNGEKNRTLHIMLGNAGESVENNAAMQCTGFQAILLRGAEWCATGKVSQALPSDFPTVEEAALRPEYKARRIFIRP